MVRWCRTSAEKGGKDIAAVGSNAIPSALQLTPYGEGVYLFGAISLVFACAWDI